MISHAPLSAADVKPGAALSLAPLGVVIAITNFAPIWGFEKKFEFPFSFPFLVLSFTLASSFAFSFVLLFSLEFHFRNRMLGVCWHSFCSCARSSES